MLKQCAENSKTWLSLLPNIGPYTGIYDVKISGFTRSSIYIYDITRLRVKFQYRLKTMAAQISGI
jgi:hypothetical protein